MNKLTDEQRTEAVCKLERSLTNKRNEVPYFEYNIAHEMETNQEHLLGAGVTFDFLDAWSQERFRTLARELFAKSSGQHRSDGGQGEVQPDYEFAIKRLPYQINAAEIKVYPLYVSDAALEVLARPREFKKNRRYLQKGR